MKRALLVVMIASLTVPLSWSNQEEGQRPITTVQIDAALKHAQETVPLAKKASDLDAVLQELSQVRDQAGAQPLSASAANISNKVQPTLQFVTAWQDYLACEAAGNIEGAREALRNVTNGNANVPFLIPRSEILARLEFMIKPPVQQADQDNSRDNSNDNSGAGPSNESDVPTVEKPLWYDKVNRKIEFKVTKLDDLDGVVTAFEDIKGKRDFRNYSADIENTIKALLPLDGAYKQFKTGLPVNIDFPADNPNTTELQIELIPLRAEMITLVLPRYLGLPSDAKLNAGEGAYDFLKRIEAEAISKSDYLLAARARDTQYFLREGKPVDKNARGHANPFFATRSQGASEPFGMPVNDPVSEETSQAQLFVTAQNQDTAGQYMFAVCSYEKALASGTDLVPPKIIGDRLAAIKSQHPDEFQRGLDLFLAPPYVRYNGYPPSWPPGSPGMQSFPGRRPASSVPASSPIPPSLTSPAK